MAQENADGRYIPDLVKIALGIGRLRTSKLLFGGGSITLTQAHHSSEFCMPNCQSSLY